MHPYSACGLAISSAIALPMQATDGASSADVILERAEIGEGAEGTRGFAGTPNFAVVTYPPHGRFEVRDGSRIFVPPEGASPSAWTAPIALGSCMPHLCHQRGLVPLHAASVLLGGRAIAFAGRSGIGKSTLLSAFLKAGHRFLSDDLCAITSAEGKATALPFGPFVKVRDEALADYPGAATFPAVAGKTWIDRSDLFHPDPAPIAAILSIADAAPDAPIEFRRLAGAEVVATAPAMISRWRQAWRSQGAAPLIARTMAVFGTVPLYVLRRPRALRRLDETVAAIERFLAEGLS